MKSLAKYLLHGTNNESPNRGKVLATNFAGSDIRSWSKEFAAFRKLKPNLSRAVAHISLNIAPDDREISDAEFIDIAHKFKAGLGYTDDCPFLLIRHADRDHQHVHLMLSRISLTGVIPETQDFRKAEKLAAALRKEFGLKGPADKKKNNTEDDPMEAQQKNDKRNAAIAARLEDAAQETDANHAAAAEPDAPCIEPYQPVSVKHDRDLRREIQTKEYLRAMDDLFLGRLRYHRTSTKGLTLYFKDGGRLYDTGTRIVAYNTPDPAIAAERLLAAVELKGWDEGFVIRGSDEFIRHAAIIALQRNLPLVALDAHQSAIIAAVRDSQGSATASIEAAPSVALLPRPLSPLKQITGSGRFGERLGSRRDETVDDGELGTDRPTGPIRPRM